MKGDSRAAVEPTEEVTRPCAECGGLDCYVEDVEDTPSSFGAVTVGRYWICPHCGWQSEAWAV